MTKKTIAQLNDILLTQENSAVVAIEQNGATFKGPVRPNPPNQINVSSQAQLEASLLGPNLIVPDNETVAVVVDAPFTLDKHFQIGDDSVLEIYGAISQNEIIWTGSGALFRNTDPLKLIDTLFIHDVFIRGNGLNSLFDIQSFKFFFIQNIQAFDLIDVGVATAFVVNIRQFSLADCKQGMRFINCPVCRLFNSGIANFNVISSGITYASFRSSGPSSVTVTEIEAPILYASDSVVFCDPNSTSTSFVIEKSPLPAFGGAFYQTGADIPISGVADNGSGNTRYTTGVPHGLIVGRMVPLDGFASETQNNGTFIVTAVDTPLTGTTFDTELVFVGGTDTGNLNTSSLDSADVQVSAERNPGQPDSMNQAEARTNTAVNLIPTVGSFKTLNDDSPSVGDFIEDPATRRFSVDDQTGIITYIGIPPIESTDIIFDVTIQKTSGGGTDTAVISLFINDTIQQTKTDRMTLPYSTAAPATVSYTGGLFTINPGDTFELKIDATGADPISAIIKIVIRG